MFLVLTKFSFHVLNVVYAGEDDGLEGRRQVTGKVGRSQLRKEIHENLIIGRRVHFINNENDWLLCPGTPQGQDTE